MPTIHWSVWSCLIPFQPAARRFNTHMISETDEEYGRNHTENHGLVYPYCSCTPWVYEWYHWVINHRPSASYQAGKLGLLPSVQITVILSHQAPLKAWTSTNPAFAVALLQRCWKYTYDTYMGKYGETVNLQSKYQYHSQPSNYGGSLHDHQTILMSLMSWFCSTWLKHQYACHWLIKIGWKWTHKRIWKGQKYRNTWANMTHRHTIVKYIQGLSLPLWRVKFRASIQYQLWYGWLHRTGYG